MTAYYDAVGRTSLTWQAVKLAKSYFVDGDRITTLVKRSGYSVKRIQNIIKRINLELELSEAGPVLVKDAYGAQAYHQVAS